MQNEVEEIENAKNNMHFNDKLNFLNNLEVVNYKNKIDEAIKNIDKKISKKLNISEIENEIIDYALQINKILIVGNEDEKANLFKPIKPEDSILTDYAQLYINRFAPSLSVDGKKFIVEIWHTNQIIGMFFKVINENEFIKDIVIKNNIDNTAIINFISRLGVEKITDKLFVQKDVRGFDNDKFFIFKPNEQRLWHKAIAYLDVNEFADAILKAGRNSE